MGLNKLNAVKVVDAAFTFPNRQAISKNTGIIIFRDDDDHPFLIYIEKMDSDIAIAEIQNNIFGCCDDKQAGSGEFEYSHKITAVDGVVYTIIDLNPPKLMTKEEIENELGYKIDIAT